MVADLAAVLVPTVLTVNGFSCRPDAFEPTCNYCADYYWRFTFYLPYFSGEWSHKMFNNPNQFSGRLLRLVLLQ
jgi:hypothetical protein